MRRVHQALFGEHRGQILDIALQKADARVVKTLGRLQIDRIDRALQAVLLQQIGKLERAATVLAAQFD